MLKITNNNIDIGFCFQIRNSWREEIAKLLEQDEELFPFNFKICDVVPKMKDVYYISESIPDNKNEKVYKIMVSSTIIKYLSGIEVSDCNVGLYFNNYLPIEGSKLLILDSKKDSFIHPVLFKFYVKTDEIYNIPVLDLNLFNLISGEIISINTQMKNSWKFLKGTDEYMNDVEKMYQDTFVHKDYVMRVCTAFCNYLRENGYNEDADLLMKRAIIHDNSKVLNKDEFRALTGIINDKSCLKDASSKLSQFKQDAIELHWKHNTHHPEHFSDYSQMNRIDRMEMVCDWYARALQYKTNFLDFVEKRQEDRFHFPELMYDEIYHYCKILVTLL